MSLLTAATAIATACTSLPHIEYTTVREFKRRGKWYVVSAGEEV